MSNRMRTAIVELDEGDVEQYRELRARDEVHDRDPASMTIDKAVQLQKDIMEFEFYVLDKYGDEDHWRGNWQIDATQGILYIND